MRRATLAVERLPEGKFKVRSCTSSVDTVIRADEVLEVRFRGGVLHVLHRPRIADQEDLPLTKMEEWGFDEKEGLPSMTSDDEDDVTLSQPNGDSVTGENSWG